MGCIDCYPWVLQFYMENNKSNVNSQKNRNEKIKPKKKVSSTGHVWSPIYIVSSVNRARLK